MTSISTELQRRFRLVGADQADEQAEFAREVREGLTAEPKRLPCRYIYDQQGSRLFEQICALPEYYLTRAEREILEQHAADIADRFTGPTTLVELGSGNSEKTRSLIDAFVHRHGSLHYVPIDVSREILTANALDMLRNYPDLNITALATEYGEGLKWLADQDSGRHSVAWLGSSIGNFNQPTAQGFLGEIAECLGADDRLLVGIDLRKDAAILEKAYNDETGVTARFNANLLARINRELDGNFDLDGFRYAAHYDPAAGRVDMYQVSTRSQEVRIGKLDLTVALEEGEAIHTESAHKYSHEEIAVLADACGLRLLHRWHDRERRFSLNFFARARS